MSSNKKEMMKILLLALAVGWVVLMVDKMAQGEPFCDMPQQGSFLALICHSSQG